MKTGNSDMCNPCATPFTNTIRWLAKAYVRVAKGNLFGGKANTMVSGAVKLSPLQVYEEKELTIESFPIKLIIIFLARTHYLRYLLLFYICHCN